MTAALSGWALGALAGGVSAAQVAATSGPNVVLSYQSLGFGSQPVGSHTSAQIVYAANAGDVAAHISGVTLGGLNPGEFKISFDTCTGATLAPMTTWSCEVDVYFAPTTAAPSSASLDFADDAASSPQKVSLSGTGTPAGPKLSFNPVNDLDLGYTILGNTSPRKSVTVTNIGSAPLHVTGVSIGTANASEFAIYADGCINISVAVNGTCQVTLTFTPSAVGSQVATLNFVDDALDTPQSYGISGWGVPHYPIAYVGGNLLPFGSRPVGTTSDTIELGVGDIGGSALVIASVTIVGANPGDFLKVSDSCSGATLQSAYQGGLGCFVDVAFRPTAAGPRTATLSFSDNDPSTPQTAGLTGTGQVAPGSPLAVSAAAANQSAILSWTVPASDGYSAITGYVVIPNHVGHGAMPPITFNQPTTTEVVYGLVNGDSYTFTVQAINAVGVSPPSAASNSISPDSTLRVPPAQAAAAPPPNHSPANQSGQAPPASGRTVGQGPPSVPSMVAGPLQTPSDLGRPWIFFMPVR